VLHDREHDLVALADIGCAPRRRHKVDCLGGVAGEHDFLRSTGIEKFRDFCPAALIGFGRRIGEIMQPAMHVGVFGFVGLGHAVEYRKRLLRGSGVVEIDELLAIDLKRQRGKILPQPRDVVGTIGNGGMGSHDALASSQRPADMTAISRRSSLAIDSMASPTKAWISSAWASFSESPRARR